MTSAVQNVMLPTVARFAPEVLKRLNRKHPWRNLAHLLFCTALFLLLGVVNTLWIPWFCWPVLWLLQGFMMVGYLSVSHDGAHLSLFHRPWQNLLCGRLCSLVILQCFSVYRSYHMEHHAHVATDLDPEPSGAFENLLDYLICLSGVQFAWEMAWTGIDALRGKFADYLKTPASRRAARIDALCLLVWIGLMVALTVVSPLYGLNLYWGPLLFYFPAVIYSGLLEHYGCDRSRDALANTRSVRPSRIYNFFDWNAGYHAEHHLFPAMPSRSYPAVAELLGDQLVYVETSYFQFHCRLIKSLLTDRARLSVTPS
jgi:fatty acid desaturase